MGLFLVKLAKPPGIKPTWSEISRKYVKLDELMEMTKELRAGYMKLEEKYKHENIHL